VINIRTLAALAIVTASACGAARADSVFAKHEMIAAANPYAAKAGLDMLRAGGSAVDAAIAAQMVLTLVEPESSGLGGGAFLVLYDPANEACDHLRRPRDRAGLRHAHHVPWDARAASRARIWSVIPGGFRSACRAWSRCWSWRTRNMAACPGRNCSSPRSSSPPTDFPSAASSPPPCEPYPEMAQMPDIKRYFYHPDGTPYREGETSEESRPRGDLARHRGPRHEGVLFRCDCGSDRRRGPARAGQSRRHDSFPISRIIARWSARPSAARIASKICARWARRVRAASRAADLWECWSAFRPATCSRTRLSEVHLFSEASRLAFADRAKYHRRSGIRSGADRRACSTATYLASARHADRSGA
jgi:gamma-glutamyltranspeptidase/glutathione hydrolase